MMHPQIKNPAAWIHGRGCVRPFVLARARSRATPPDRSRRGDVRDDAQERTCVRETIPARSGCQLPCCDRAGAGCRCRRPRVYACGAPMPTTAGAPVFAARGLTKVYEMGEVTVQALRGVDFDLLSGRVRRAARPVRIGQVHAAEHPRRPRRADVRRRHLSGPQPDDRRRGGAHRLPAHPRRLRLPVLQPHSEPDGARERRARHRDRLEIR